MTRQSDSCQRELGKLPNVGLRTNLLIIDGKGHRSTSNFGRFSLRGLRRPRPHDARESLRENVCGKTYVGRRGEEKACGKTRMRDMRDLYRKTGEAPAG
jgi:hypothetical protein